MFNNAINIGRQSVFTLGSLALLSPSYRTRPLKLRHSRISFICSTCLIRRYGSKRKGIVTTKSGSEPFLKNSIKTLESHVQFLKSSFKEMLDRRTKAGPNLPISEPMQDRAYDTLMLDTPSVPLLQSSEKSIYQLLPARFLQRLGPSNIRLIKDETPDWASFLENLSSSVGFRGFKRDEIESVIRCMDPKSTAKNTELVLKLLREAGFSAETRIYDLLMMGNASYGDMDTVKKLFSLLKEQGCKPTVYSYGHLLKALAADADIIAAAGAFKEMQDLKIEPNLTVYTTLLHICIRAKEINIAWKVFDLMKYRGLSTHPDVKAYSLMIHACALRAEAEKALDLFNDMTVRRNIEPTALTYNSLIHACAMRKDYYAQAWQFARDMQSRGMPFTTRTVNLLLLACGRIGELTRARMLLRHMMASSESVQPDEETFHALFRAYANYQPRFTKKASKEFKLKASSLNTPTSSLGTLVHLKLDAPERAASDDALFSSQRLMDFDFLTRACPSSHPDTVEEVKMVYELVKKHYPEFVSTQLTNSLLEVYLQQGYHDTLERAYSLLYKPVRGSDDSTGFALHPADDLKFLTVDKNVYTFEIALQSAYKSRNIGFARQIYSQREEYVRLPIFMKLSSSFRDDVNFNAERIYIDTLARCEFLGEACERLKTHKDAFGPGRWKWEVLKRVRVKAVQLEDMKTVFFLDTFACDGLAEGELERNVQEVEGTVGWELRGSGGRSVGRRRKKGSTRPRAESDGLYSGLRKPEALNVFSH